jgi:hypothetical protein
MIITFQFQFAIFDALQDNICQKNTPQILQLHFPLSEMMILFDALWTDIYNLISNFQVKGKVYQKSFCCILRPKFEFSCLFMCSLKLKEK